MVTMIHNIVLLYLFIYLFLKVHADIMSLGILPPSIKKSIKNNAYKTKITKKWKKEEE